MKKDYQHCLRQRPSHLILIGAAKLSFKGAELCWRGSASEKKGEKMVQFHPFQGVFQHEFHLFFFLRHFLSILSSDFIGAACHNNNAAPLSALM